MSFFEKALKRVKLALNKSDVRSPAGLEQQDSPHHKQLRDPKMPSSGSRDDSVPTPRGSPMLPSNASAESFSSNQSGRSFSSSHDEAIAAVLQNETVDLEELRKLCWSGCPAKRRSECWNLLTGYFPASRGQQDELITRKRAEYQKHVSSSHASVPWEEVLQSDFGATPRMETTIAISQEDVAIMKQIRKDAPRTSSGLPLLQHSSIQDIIERVLYIWAVRHPACGYVQGMNDVLLPFIFVQLAGKVCPKHHSVSYLLTLKEEVCSAALNSITNDEWSDMEADLYWNVSRLLERLQEMYTFNQAGCHAMVQKLEYIMRAIDPPLCKHLETCGIFFAEFAFRWMNCLLLREFQPNQFVRLWDTYLSESDVAAFHVYVCCALLRRWSNTLQQLPDMASALRFLQNPPTSFFVDRDIDELTSSAFLIQQLYDKVPHHLHPNGGSP